MPKFPTFRGKRILATLSHSSFCPTHPPHTQCEETNPDEPGSLSQQSSLWKNKDKNPSDSFWILMEPISKGEQEHRSLPQVLKSAPKSRDSSPRSPLKNSTMKMNLYFKSKLVRYSKMKAEEEVPSKQGTTGLFPSLVFSPQGPSWCWVYYRCSINTCDMNDLNKKRNFNVCFWGRRDFENRLVPINITETKNRFLG